MGEVCCLTVGIVLFFIYKSFSSPECNIQLKFSHIFSKCHAFDNVLDVLLKSLHFYEIRRIILV